jgi:pantoate--beta-alanine ligase
VADLDLPGEVVVCPTVRDLDGLALSSRNRFLSAEDRERARAIPRALASARRLAAGGERTAAALERHVRDALGPSGLVPDYVAVRDPGTFAPVSVLGRPALLVVAARAGSTRLLDNEWVAPPEAA